MTKDEASEAIVYLTAASEALVRAAPATDDMLFGDVVRQLSTDVVMVKRACEVIVAQADLPASTAAL